MSGGDHSASYGLSHPETYSLDGADGGLRSFGLAWLTHQEDIPDEANNRDYWQKDPQPVFADIPEPANTQGQGRENLSNGIKKVERCDDLDSVSQERKYDGYNEVRQYIPPVVTAPRPSGVVERARPSREVGFNHESWNAIYPALPNMASPTSNRLERRSYLIQQWCLRLPATPNSLLILFKMMLQNGFASVSLISPTLRSFWSWRVWPGGGLFAHALTSRASGRVHERLPIDRRQNADQLTSHTSSLPERLVRQARWPQLPPHQPHKRIPRTPLDSPGTHCLQGEPGTGTAHDQA